MMDFKTGLYNPDGSGETGSSDIVLKIKRDADDYFYDFDDSTFKTSGHTDIDQALSEPDATNAPGEYEASVDVSGFDDGVYTAYFVYSGSPAWTDSVEFWVHNGKEASAIVDVTVDGSIDYMDAFVTLLAMAAGSMAKSGDTYTHKDQSGNAKITSAVSATAVTRTIA